MKEHPRYGVQGIKDLPGWEALFKRWANKKILLAGDSQMKNFMYTVLCTALFLGADVGKPVNMTGVALGPTEGGCDLSSWKIRGLPFFTANESSTNSSSVPSIQVDNLYYYTLTDSCGTCSLERGPCNCEEDVVPVAGGHVMRMGTLTGLMRDHDETVLNIGHDMMVEMPIRNIGRFLLRKLERLTLSLQLGGVTDLAARLTFLEHFAQHYPWLETGDWIGLPYANFTTCGCRFSRLEKQRIFKRNRLLGNFSQRRQLRVAQVWSYTAAEGCEMHMEYPDCTHYALVPSFWDKIALSVAAA